jgi:hypothetical protein
MLGLPDKPGTGVFLARCAASRKYRGERLRQTADAGLGSDTRGAANGPGFHQACSGIEEDVLSQGSLLHSELRDQGSDQILWAGRPGSARNFDSGTADVFKDVVNSALKATGTRFLKVARRRTFPLALST